MPWLIIGIIFGILLLIELFIWLLLEFSFHRRSNQDPFLKYFTATDFADISAEPIEFLSGKNALRGFIYTPRRKKPSRLIIFMMGIGAGHHAYMHVIRELALHDYRVLAFDYTGAELSQGKYIKGLPQALHDLKACLTYISERDDLSSLPLDIIGHSWGGYASGIAPLISSKFRRVISISGFNNVPSVLSSVRPYLKIFELFIDFANWLKFGNEGIYDITSAIKQGRVPMLFIAGLQDQFVKAKQFERFQLLAKDNPNIHFYLEQDKNHNPYLTREAEQYFIKILKEKKKYDRQPYSTESQQFYKSIDYDLITKNDSDIFKVIFDFLDR